MKPDGILALNFQVGRRSELVQRQFDRRFFEYYRDSSEVAKLLRAAGFGVEAALYGETKRNTHDLDITLKWSTLYARPDLVPKLSKGSIIRKNGQAQVALGLAPGQEVDIFNSR